MLKVEESFEICALLFRFAPGTGFDEEVTPFQQSLAEIFGKHANHPAVKYVKSLEIGLDAVANFAVHIYKEDGKFYLAHDLTRLIADDRWCDNRPNTLIALLNDFYVDTNFGTFFESKADFYKVEADIFIANQYGKINFDWFAKYIDVCKMICIFSPSIQNVNFGATAHGNTYAIVPHNSAIIHELCHAFANPIGEEWYATYDAFRKMCDDTAAMKKIPWYTEGITFAREYTTRAYNILHDYAQGETDLEARIAREIDAGGMENTPGCFPYIAQVYAMVVERES